MIEVVEGLGVGAGKSYFVCKRIISVLAVGGTVFASDTFGLLWDNTKALVERRYGVLLEDGQYNVFAEDDVPRLHEVTPQGSDDCPVFVVVDECHTKLNARDWADTSKRPFFNWLTQSRHDDTDVMFISQAAANMDKQIVRLVTFIWRIRNMANFKIPGLGKWPFKQFVAKQLDSNGRTVLDTEWMSHDTEIFKCYKSKSMKGRHRRSGQVISRRNLVKSRTTQNQSLWAALWVILAYIIWDLFLS